MYIMMKNLPSFYDIKYVEYRIKDILLDPLTILDVLIGKGKDLFSSLKAVPEYENHLKYVGNGVYFHTKQSWGDKVKPKVGNCLIRKRNF